MLHDTSCHPTIFQEIMNYYMKAKKIKYLHKLHGWLGGGGDCENGCGGGGGDKKARGLFGDRGTVGTATPGNGEGTESIGNGLLNLLLVSIFTCAGKTRRETTSISFTSITFAITKPLLLI